MTLQQLDRLRSLSAQIRRYDELSQRLRARAERLTTVQSGMPSGTHGQDEMADLIAQLVDNERKAAERVLQLHRECEVAEAWIDTLPEQQRRVMRTYYIDGAKSWLEVADRLPFTYRHVKRIKAVVMRKLGNDSPLCPLKS